MLQRNEVLNWINDHLLFSFSCSNTFSSFPVHLGDCSRLMGLSQGGLREWSLFSCLWPRSGWCFSSSWLLQTALYLALPISHRFFPWGDPKHFCQKLVCVHPVTWLWLRLISEHHLPASWRAVFWSPTPWLKLSAALNVLPACLIAWLIAGACCSLWRLLLSQACTSLPGYLQPLLLVRWREECLCA